MKKIFFIFLLATRSLKLPFVNTLQKIYDIKNAEGITLIPFSHYQDKEAYGTLPKVLNPADLKFLSSTTQWDNPINYQIKSKKDLYIAHVHQGFISSTSLGTVFDNKQQFLFDIMVNPGNSIFWPLEERMQKFKIISYDKIATAQGPTLFYHWLIDRMPSILLLKELMDKDPEIRLIINRIGTIPSYVFQYLNLLGIPHSRLIIPQPNTMYHAHNLYFATPFLIEPIPKALLLKLRNMLIKASYEKLPQKYNHNLVIIIQRREPDRRIKNLEEVIQILKPFCQKKNYELLIFDASQNIEEQIQIFNNAKIVMGIMASGLTNTLFVQPETNIIEIHSTYCTTQGSEWCWWLASAVNAHYWMIPLAFNLSDHFINFPIQPLENIIQSL